jgi:uncharacterized protein YggE
MKRTIALAIAFAALPAAAAAQIVPAPPPAEPGLTVQGQGVIKRSPDQGELSVSIVTNDPSATASASHNNDVFAALKTRLAAASVSADAIRTTSFDVEFVPYPPKGLPPERQQARYGYVTTRTLALTVAPLENLGKAIDAANAAGATEVGNVQYELHDRHGAYLAALAAAMEDARASAQALAAAGGFTLANIRTVNAGNDFVQQPVFGGFAPRMNVAVAAPTPTDVSQGGPIEVTAHVTITYAIH